MSSNIPPCLASPLRRGYLTRLAPALLRHASWGGVVLFASLLSACTFPETSPPSPLSPVSSSALPPSEPTVNLVMEALANKDFTEARIRIERMPPSRDRKLLSSLLGETEKSDLILRVLLGVSHPSTYPLAEPSERLYTLSPEIFHSFFLSLSNSGQKKILQELIENGKERLAIRIVHQLHTYQGDTPLIASAYAHWAQRREKENRLFDARGLARQALKMSPRNSLAHSVDRKIEKLRREKITEGLLAYRHRHLHQAIALWEEARAIDPSQEEPKRYILKAQAILEKIRSLTPTKQ